MIFPTKDENTTKFCVLSWINPSGRLEHLTVDIFSIVWEYCLFHSENIKTSVGKLVQLIYNQQQAGNAFDHSVKEFLGLLTTSRNEIQQILKANIVNYKYIHIIL